MRFFSLLALLLIAFRAAANDANSSGVGGSWRLLKSEHSQIQMVREHIRIVPHTRGFQTTADFVFRNHGAATTVTMGFPESQGGVDREGAEAWAAFRVHPTLTRFASWVDGRRVRVKRRVLPDFKISVEALWTKTVAFKRHQTRRVRVRYVSESGGGDSNGGLSVEYNFTGGNWRGKVEESILDVKLHNGSQWFLDYDEEQKKSLLWRRGNRFRFRWRNWQAQKSFALAYRWIFPNELLNKTTSFFMPRGDKPSYLDLGYESRRELFPYAVTVPDALLQRGRLWVAARKFSPQWDEKRKGVILKRGGRRAFVSAVGSTRRSTLWPLAPNGSFWISERGNLTFMVPARQIAKQLGGRFGLDFQNGRAIFVQGKKRTLLRANPY